MLYSSLLNSIASTKQNKLRFASIVLTDFLNFFAFGLVHFFYFMMLLPKLQSITQLSGLRTLQAFDSQTDEQISQVMSQITEFTSLYNEIITLIIYYALSLLLLWIIFQSVSWYLSSTNKPKLKQYFKFLYRFSISSLLFFAGLSLLIYFIFKVIFLFSFTDAQIKPDAAPYLVITAIILISYFTFILNLTKKTYYNQLSKNQLRRMYSLYFLLLSCYSL
jgi:hypothetical protein